jgi:hypothetical protein
MRSSPLRSAVVLSGLLVCVRCAPTVSDTSALGSFPAAARMTEDASPIHETAAGFELEAPAPASGLWRPPSVRAELSRSPGEPMWISAPGLPGRVGVLASDDHALVATGSVVRAGSSRFLFARAGTIEDLALAVAPTDRTREWRLSLPPGLTLRAIADANVAEVIDAQERPLLRVRADRAWDALGRALTPSLAVSNDTIRVTIPEDAHYPVLVDPTWTTAATPIFLRVGHTATSLGDGRVLFAGGGTAPSSTEIYDPWSGRFVASGKMVAARTGHTATLLQSGKVLLAGGDKAGSAEIYDPTTGTFTPTASMSAPHGGGLRLASGKVLFTGGSDANAEIYDEATGKFAAIAPRSAAGSVALATLASGRVLAVGDAGSDIFDVVKGTWTPVPSAPTGPFATATLTRFGNVLVTMAQGCFSASGSPAVCSLALFDFDETANSGAGGFTQLPGNIQSIEAGFTATLLTTGSVLLVPSSGDGGGPPSPTIYDPQSKMTSGDTALTTPHRGATATLLPGGDVLVVGGDQTSVDLRVSPGVIATGAFMATARQGHAAVRLRDGRLLVVDSAAVGNPGPIACGPSGCPTPPDQTRSAEIYDPVTHQFTVTTGAPAFSRTSLVLALLPSGKVLVTGGYGTGGVLVPESEIFDPATGSFHTAGKMLAARWSTRAASLPDGRVLVVGGAVDTSGNATDTTEIFDPKTETFSAGPKMLEKLRDHGVVKMPTGDLLVVGSSTAEIYDPLKNAFRAAASPPAAVDGSTAQLLPDGRVFVASASTLASLLYDAATDAWSFSANGVVAAAGVVWTPTVDGRVFSVGGLFAVGGESRQELYDPSSGRAVVAASTGLRIGAVGAMVASGDTVITGGNSTGGEGVSHPLSSSLVYSQGALATSRPTITSIVPAQVTGGASITIKGTGFTSGAEGSTGNGRSTPANAPIAVWLSDATGAVIPGRVTAFTDTTATWIAPPTALTGHGWLFVYSNGVASVGAELTILPAENAVRCRFDADCKTGFCTDGVCCDQRCDGVCQGCSAAHKTTGADGVCGPVPPGNRDIAHRCFADNGQSCEAADECKSGFCIDGSGGGDGGGGGGGGTAKKLCCDAPCVGACLSCTQPASVGACTAVSEGACDVACDGAHTLKRVGQPDVDCAPLTCSGKTCRTSCASTRDCVAPFVCDDTGACVTGVNPPPSDASLLGCSVSAAGARGDRDRGDRGLSRVLGALATALAMLVLRRRRR